MNKTFARRLFVKNFSTFVLKVFFFVSIQTLNAKTPKMEMVTKFLLATFGLNVVTNIPFFQQPLDCKRTYKLLMFLTIHVFSFLFNG